MALTRDQVRDLQDDPVRTVPLPVAEGRSPQPVGEWAMAPEAVSINWRRGLALAWVVVFAAAILLEPAAADPGASDPLWAVALFGALTGALAAMGVGLVRGRRAGLLAGVVAAGLALVGSVLCPVSGHHGTVGAWWYLQMAGFAGLIGATLVALRVSRSA